MWRRKQSSEFWRALQKESNFECPRSSLGYEEGTGPSCCVRDNGTRVNVKVLYKHCGTSTRLPGCLLVCVNSDCRLLTCWRTLFWFNGLSHAVVHTKQRCSFHTVSNSSTISCNVLTRIRRVFSISLHQMCGITVKLFIFVSSLFFDSMANLTYVFQISGIKIRENKRVLIRGVQQLGGKYIGGSVSRDPAKIHPKPDISALPGCMITQSLFNSLRD